jgi:2'-5' RNA ligase
MPRLFTGLSLPEDVVERLARLKSPLPGAKWIEPQDMHLTLRFAGDVSNPVAEEFADALGQISAEAFSLRIAGVGAFGGNDPHTLFASVEPNAGLEALARANERAARKAGLAAEGRGFKPHVTLARFRHGQPDAIARYLSRHGGFACEPITVDSFVLFSSRPKVGGGPYVVEAQFPLVGAASGFDWAAHRQPG